MTRLALTVCPGVLVLSLLHSPALAGKDLSKVRNALEAASDTLVRATLAGDVETVMSFYDDDAVSMPNYHGILEGIRAIREYQENMFAVGVRFHSMEFDTLDLWQCRDLVYETGQYRISVTSPGMPEPVTDRGQFMTVWRRSRGDDLKIKAEIWNSDLNPWAMAAQQGVAGEAQEDYDRLREARKTLQEMANDLRERAYIGLDGDWDDAVGGYRVSGFAEGTMARDAGVRIGDVLVAVNGIPLSDTEASAADAPNRRPGREAEITVVRDRIEKTMTVTLMAATERIVAEEIGKFVLRNYLD